MLFDRRQFDDLPVTVVLRGSRGLALAGAVLLAALPGAGRAEPAPPAAAGAGVGALRLTVPLAQAHDFAQQALLRGQPAVALQVARALLGRDPQDVRALLIESQALGLLGQPEAAVSAARAAYRLAGNRTERFQAALLIGGALGAGRHWMRAQFWLRRASDLAPDAQARARTAATFQRLRGLDPWEVRLDFSVRPSSNVNGGAESSLLTIQGLPVVGFLSGTAQALSGRQETLHGSLSYRLSRSARQRTDLGARVTLQATQLSASARALAPGVRGSDFNFDQAELFLSRRFVLGKSPDVNSASLSVGRSWFGGALYDRHLRLDLTREHAIDARNSLRLGLSAARQWLDGGMRANGYALEADLAHRIGGGTLGGALGLLQVASSNDQMAYVGGWARLSYSFGRPVAGARLSASLTAGANHYPHYAVFFAVPGGRWDRYVNASLSAQLDRFSYLGFAPVVTLAASRSTSNVSRFTISTLGLGVGVQSRF